MQNVKLIAQNAGQTVQNEACTMQNIGHTMRNVGHNHKISQLQVLKWSQLAKVSLKNNICQFSIWLCNNPILLVILF